ncbi:MAG: TIGR00730 family Rossman fold protein [Alphaproteobacteria bacterium]|nr:TIGR00730 family Rossman fold protein [Alphaproteobacteria bacterium]
MASDLPADFKKTAQKHISNIAVYCGSRSGAHPIFEQEARTLGSVLAKNQYKLTYGSGGAGLMGAVAESAARAGGEVAGINVPIFAEQGQCPDGVVEHASHMTMFQRKAELIEMTQASIALTGGIETFDEIGDSIVDNDIKKHRNRDELIKPTLLINTQIQGAGGYYDELDAWIKKSLKFKFANANAGSLYTLVPSAEHAVLMLDLLNKQGPVTAGEAQDLQMKHVLKPEFLKIYKEKIGLIPVPCGTLDGGVEFLQFGGASKNSVKPERLIH